MTTHLHLLRADSVPLAASVIASVTARPQCHRRPPDDARAPSLLDRPPAQLGENGLDSTSLLDLIFAADHVAAW
jgi:hypothetical protein